MPQSADIDARVTRLEEQVDAHERRITSHGQKLDSLNESVVKYHARTDEILKTISTTVERIDKRLEEEERRPAESWHSLSKSIVGYVLGGVAAVLAGILALVLAHAGLDIL